MLGIFYTSLDSSMIYNIPQPYMNPQAKVTPAHVSTLNNGVLEDVDRKVIERYTSLSG